MVESDTVWFKRFGIKQNVSKKTGEEMSGFDRDESAHELLLLQNYTSLSSYYGIPEVISAILFAFFTFLRAFTLNQLF